MSLSEREARIFVRNLHVESGRRVYLVRGAVATGTRLPLGAYYRTAQQMDLIAWWHPSDQHFELVSMQMGRAPFVFNKVAFIVQTEHRIRSASAVCYLASEG